MFPDFNVKETFIWEEAEEELGAKHKTEVDELNQKIGAIAQEKDAIAQKYDSLAQEKDAIAQARNELETGVKRTIVNLYFDMNMSVDVIAKMTGQTIELVKEVIAKDMPNKN